MQPVPWILALVLHGAAPAPGLPAGEPFVVEEDPAEVLVGAYKDALKGWKQDYRLAFGREERAALDERHPAVSFLPRFVTAGEAGDGSALLWATRLADDARLAEDERKGLKHGAYTRLVAEFGNSPWFREVVVAVDEDREDLGVDVAADLLEHVAEHGATAALKAEALWRWGGLLIDTEQPDRRAAGLAIWERLFAEHPRTVQSARARAEYDLEKHLGIGSVARDFEATDLQGRAFRLSDYRGKVVVLDFWGFWCPACRRSLPHLARLVERHADEPFALLGVNSDTDLESVRSQVKGQHVTWRNAFDGGPKGPLSRAWRVRSFPTVYVLDHEGRIRARNIHGEDLDRKVAELLAEL
ncbi:MAG: redoxin domain-containing protein [Planctomycetota bacterium]|jgi:thiol-disulfide isomerase/thioredoxin|nr:redoxin domain-containing protein [Planctomycetota bacterium]MDP6989426.1 redoxin domain-containing protein [Planctomycetota bacterium]